MATGQSYRLTVTVGGINLGTFDGMSSGGGATAPTSMYTPGAMGAPKTEKATPAFDPITLTIGNQKSLYWTNTMKWLFSVCGSAAMSVGRTPIDPVTKKSLGVSITYIGVLNAAAPGAVDATDTATEQITLGMSVDSAS